METTVIRLGGACLLAALACACSPRSAEEKGAQMAGEKIDLVSGIGNALTDKGGRAAESLASGVGTVVKGVERGAMKVGRKISADPSLAAAGLTVTKVQDASGNDAPHGLEAYLVAKSGAEGSLRMFAYDALGREIGRASVPVMLGGDDARYLGLPLDRQVDPHAVASVGFKFVPAAQVAAK